MSLLGDLSNKWEKVKQQLELHHEASKHSDKSNKFKLQLLFNQMGDEAMDVFNTFVFAPGESKDNFNDVIRKFEEYCKPRKNVVFNRFNFFSRAQEVGESIDKYVTDLSKLASECDFENQTESLIRDKLVLGILDKKVQKRLLWKPDLHLKEALDFSRANELQSKRQGTTSAVQEDQDGNNGEKSSRQDETVTLAIKKENEVNWKENTQVEIPSHPNSCSQIKTEAEELEFNLVDLHHSISIKDESSTVEYQREPEISKKPFTCEICGNKYKLKGNLKVHLKTHTGEKSFACEMCDFRTAIKDSLKVHIRLHTGEKPFTCGICGYKCARKANLKIHFIGTHNGEKPFKCKTCSFTTAYKRSLKFHLRTHTGEKPYTCRTCNYIGTVDGHSKKRLKIQPEKKLFACEICDSKFTEEENLTSHLSTHRTGDKPFTCEICGYKCSLEFSLQMHSRICKYI